MFSGRNKELKDLLFTVIILGFCFSFRKWGIESFDLSYGLKQFIFISILVGVSLLIRQYAQKVIAKKYNATTEYVLWRNGALLALVLVILTNGYFIFAAPGTILINALHKYRIGRKAKRVYLGLWDKGVIALAGSIASITIAIMAKILIHSFAWMESLMIINIWIALFNMIPFLNLSLLWIGGGKEVTHELLRDKTLGYIEGEYIFAGSRPLWFFATSLLTVIGVSLLFLSALASVFLGLIGGITIYFVYWYITWSGANWGQPSP